jgi:hypothetical protein
MPYNIRVLLNRALEEGAEGAITETGINEKIAISGELTEIDTFELYFNWQEGTRNRASSAGAASVVVGRKLENKASDMLADTLLAGSKQRGDPQVFPLRIYEIDNTQHGWKSVVNEWRLDRAVVASATIRLGAGTQTITLIGTDIQLFPQRGKLGNCPVKRLTDHAFLKA